MIDPHNRVVLISGANRGIGRAIAICLYNKGYTVSAGARDVDALIESLGHLDNDRLLLARYDACDRQTQNNWVNKTQQRFGRIDALVNNAGTSNTFKIDSGDESELDALWAINVKGPLFLTRACLPLLKESGQGVRATALCPSFVDTDLTAGVTKITREEMIDPADLAEMAAMVIALPNTAAVAELLMNCRLEDTL